MSAAKDPTAPIRLKASRYPGVDQGTSCTQSSFKANKKAFLYIGMQGGRYKAMFKLRESASEAAKLAIKEPDRYEVGSTSWVTARFTAEKPMPKKIWEAWLNESYGLCVGPPSAATSGKPKKRAKTVRKEVVNKTTKKKAGRSKA